MARRSPRVRDSRERILSSALALFGERGYLKTSIDEIAARAGLTKGAVYYYFEDKDDLARDLHHELWARLKTDAVKALDPAADTLTNLKRAFDAHLTALQGLAEARFFLREFWVVPRLDVAGRSEHEAAIGLVEKLLREGVTRGEIAPLDVGAMARALLGAFSEATLHVLTTGRPAASVAVVHALIDALARRDGGRTRSRKSRR